MKEYFFFYSIFRCREKKKRSSQVLMHKKLFEKYAFQVKNPTHYDRKKKKQQRQKQKRLIGN